MNSVAAKWSATFYPVLLRVAVKNRRCQFDNMAKQTKLVKQGNSLETTMRITYVYSNEDRTLLLVEARARMFSPGVPVKDTMKPKTMGCITHKNLIRQGYTSLHHRSILKNNSSTLNLCDTFNRSRLIDYTTKKYIYIFIYIYLWYIFIWFPYSRIREPDKLYNSNLMSNRGMYWIYNPD